MPLASVCWRQLAEGVVDKFTAALVGVVNPGLLAQGIVNGGGFQTGGALDEGRQARGVVAVAGGEPGFINAGDQMPDTVGGAGQGSWCWCCHGCLAG